MALVVLAIFLLNSTYLTTRSPKLVKYRLPISITAAVVFIVDMVLVF